MSDDTMNVLLVEDDETQITLIRHAFDETDKAVNLSAVQSLGEAREFLQQQRPDLVIADYELDDGKGMELLGSERGILPYPVIIVSGHGDESVAAEAIKAGASEYISKTMVPFSKMPEIARRVRQEWTLLVERLRNNHLELQQFSKLSDHLPMMINAFDEQGRTVYWNRECERVTGYRAEEIFCCKDVLALLYPDAEYRKAMLKAWQDAGGHLEDQIWRLTAKDGSEKIISWRNISDTIPVDGWSSWAVGHDVSEQVRSKIILENKKQKMQAIVDHMQDGLIAINETGNVLSFNHAAERLFGYNAEEVINKNVRMLMPENHSCHHDAYLEKYAIGGISCVLGHDTEVEIRCKDGRLVSVILGVAEIKLEEGRQFIGTITDITEHKQLEAAQRLAAIAFESHEGITIADENANILRVNRAFTEITGYTEAEVIGQNLRILQTGRHDAEFYQRMWQMIKDDGCWHGEIWNKRKNGEIYPELLSITAVNDESGKTSHYVTHFQDISEIVQMHSEMQASQARMQSILDNTHAIVYTKNSEGQFQLVNREFERTFNFPAGQAIGKSETELFPEVSATAIRTRDAAVWTTGTLVESEVVHIGINGPRTYLSTKFPLFDVDGKITGLGGIAHDITDRKQAEQDIRDVEARLRLILDSAGEGIYGLDLEGNTTFINRAAAKMIGWNAEDLIGKSQHAVLHHSRADGSPFPREECPIYAALIDNEVHHVIDEVFWRKDGSSFPVEFTSTPMLKDGESIGAVVVFKDISERKKAEAELAFTNTILSTQQETSIDGILISDGDGQVISINQRYCEIWGLPTTMAETNSSKKLLACVLPQVSEPDTFLQRVEALYAEKDARAADVIELLDGRTLERYTAPMRGADGQWYGRVWYFRDISARKQAAAELEQTNKELMAAHRQAGMSEVASGVLHNVGNILNSINVSSSMIADKISQSRLQTGLENVLQLLDAHSADLGHFLGEDKKGRCLPDYLHSLAEHYGSEQKTVLDEFQSIRNNIEHIKTIVNRQQSYASSAGVTETIVINELLEDVLAMSISEAHNINIVVDAEALPMVTVDKAKVMQILVNLVRNAKHALDARAGEDKRLIVRICINEQQSLCIEVIDNGIGIAAEHRDNIFHYGHTTRKDGHGFGLHASALAAQDMGGSLSFDSDGPGRGATFRLELPIEVKEKAA